mmetsp:Transcript_27208/g.48110  ORF Transcript_27208/g.48110 Transcript_27208/m.48110 type:complete len:167 (+) Transcript_27208:2-502(+)
MERKKKEMQSQPGAMLVPSGPARGGGSGERESVSGGLKDSTCDKTRKRGRKKEKNAKAVPKQKQATGEADSEPRKHNLGAVMAVYGDDAEPLRESIDLMEDMVRDFVDELIQDMTDVAGGTGKLQVLHLLCALRKDHAKYNFAKERYKSYKAVYEAKKSASSILKL